MLNLSRAAKVLYVHNQMKYWCIIEHIVSELRIFDSNFHKFGKKNVRMAEYRKYTFPCLSAVLSNKLVWILVIDNI